MKVTLYKCDARNAIRVWSIEAMGAALHIEHGQLHGAMQAKTEFIATNLSGRSLNEQVALQLKSKINKQLDKGYRISIEDAMASKGLNALMLRQPMLAKKYIDVKIDYRSKVYVQPKLDGNRCLITMDDDGELIAYSRNGKHITTIGHILQTIQGLKPGYVIDGEIYTHGQSLQTIMSWTKREQEDSGRLQYHAYDLITPAPRAFASRYAELQDLSGDIRLVDTYLVSSESEVHEHFKQFRNNGLEGAMVRWGTSAYEDGKRSASIVKVKSWEDDEFKVIDITPSKDGWAILTCITDKGVRFGVSAPGTIAEKAEVLADKDIYIGRYVTVEYAYVTADGSPFHPVAKGWREACYTKRGKKFE